MIVKTSVSLPESLVEAAKSAYLAKGYTSLSAYLQDLLRKDIEKGSNVGEPTEMSTLKAQVAHLTQLVESRLPLIAEESSPYTVPPQDLKAKKPA